MRMPNIRIPRTNDEFINYLFRVLLYLYRREVRAVGWVKDLRRPGARRVPVDGLFKLVGTKYRIFLDDSIRARPLFAARVLLHELIHCLVTIEHPNAEEEIVLEFERLIWKRLSRAQMRFLVRLLPHSAHYLPKPR